MSRNAVLEQIAEVLTLRGRLQSGEPLFDRGAIRDTGAGAGGGGGAAASSADDTAGDTVHARLPTDRCAVTRRSP